MDRDQTPIKSVCNIFGHDSPTSFQSQGDDEKMSSPAYVKWDFDLPPVPEKIKNEALELGREVNEHKLIRRRSRNRPSPYCSLRNFQVDSSHPADGTPTRISSYSRSVNLLKEALGDIPNNDNVKTDNPTTEHPKDNYKSDFDDILFDDSFNDCLNECSQSIETDFYKQNTLAVCASAEKRVGDKTNVEDISKTIEPPSSSRTGTEKSVTDTRELTDKEPKELTDLSKEIDEIDDHLFLEIDLNSLY